MENNTKKIRPDAHAEHAFQEKLDRLKFSLGVQSDSDLARALQVTQQAVFGAKKRRNIPQKWLDTAISRGASYQYIMEGKTEHGEIAKEPPMAFDKQIEDLESRIAADIVALVEAKTESKFDGVLSNLLRTMARHAVIPSAVRQTEALLKEINQAFVPGDNSNEKEG